MPYNILILPLLGGFVFISRWNRSRWYAVRAEKERLLFFAALAGFAWLVIAFAINVFVAPRFPCQPGGFCLPIWWSTHIPFEHSGISFSAFVLAVTMWKPLNWVRRWSRDVQTAEVVKSQGGALEQFLDTAMQRKKHVMLTLKSGKVYVGRIVSAFEPGQRDQTILVFPTLSGYRDNLKHEVSFTTNYDTVYASIRAEYADSYALLLKQFRIVVPISEILAITFFNYDIHDRYFTPPTSKSKY
jgi:hypothetical protein